MFEKSVRYYHANVRNWLHEVLLIALLLGVIGALSAGPVVFGAIVALMFAYMWWLLIGNTAINKRDSVVFRYNASTRTYRYLFKKCGHTIDIDKEDEMTAPIYCPHCGTCHNKIKDVLGSDWELKDVDETV
jgi:hypothetical protein